MAERLNAGVKYYNYRIAGMYARCKFPINSRDYLTLRATPGSSGSRPCTAHRAPCTVHRLLLLFRAVEIAGH